MFDAFGITRKWPGAIHHTMMSSTTCASSRVEQVGVLRAPRLDAVEVVGERPLQGRERTGPGDEERAEVRDVEHHRPLAARAVLLEDTAVLERHLPPTELDHARAQRAVLRVERAVAQRPRQADSAAACGGAPDRDGGGARSSGFGSVASSPSATSCDGGSSPYFTSRWR